ncbi:MAG: OmpA family protein [Limisphaerales bacterium]
MTRSKSTLGISRLSWIATLIMGLLAVIFLVLWLSTKAQQQRELESLQTRLDETTSTLSNKLAENQTNQDLITALKSQVADLENDKEMAAQMAKGLENEMRADLESKDVTISNLQGKLTVNILDRVMFDSGEAVLKPDGQAVMQKVAAILAKHPELKIHVVGHTDNVPIRPAAQRRFASNWELSTARALAAVHFLTEQAGVDPRRVGAVGYGEYRPLASNSTAEGRAMNRRIVITILSDELAGADIVPVVKSNVPTNAPPSAPVPDTPAPPPQ